MEYSTIFHNISFTIFFDLEEIFFENFNNSENNLINVELTKVLRCHKLKANVNCDFLNFVIPF
jgi:hypothetical protein